MAKLYLVLTLLGIALPFSAFIPWLSNYGVNPQALISAIIENNISLFAWLDVLVSAVVLIVFIVTNGKKHQVPYRWFAIVGTLTIGVSCGFPLYLYLKERHLQHSIQT